MTRRNRRLVRCIWFCIELGVYDSHRYHQWRSRSKYLSDRENKAEREKIVDTVKGPFTKAFQTLLSTLSTWGNHGRLTLDISVYSPSDSEHWLKELTCLPDTPADRPESDGGSDSNHDPRHGWVDGSQKQPPPRDVCSDPFWSIWNDLWADENDKQNAEKTERQWWQQLPSAPIVSSLLLRQQTRWQWKLFTLGQILGRFPGLQELHYEPWGPSWDMDKGYHSLLRSLQGSNHLLKSIVIFQQSARTRYPSLSDSQMMSLSSIHLEHLSASFIVDAEDFFETNHGWRWRNLTKLVLTSASLAPASNSEAMLQTAAGRTTKMPCLETMEIWNGGRGLAALFSYRANRERKEAVITWRATWELTMAPAVIRSWEAVAQEQGGLRLSWTQDRLDEDMIKCVGDAIHYLKMSGQVLRPVSLWQIRMEHEFLERARAS